MRLTLNVLLTLIVQAKITGRGRTGNGRLFIRLLSILADSRDPELSRERNTLSYFSDAVSKADAYKKTDRFLFDFLQTGNGYPVKDITLIQFESSVNCTGKCNWQLYRRYLAETGNFCTAVLDPQKIFSLVSTLLQLLAEDETITSIYYAGTFMPKSCLIGTAAHPVQLCLEAFLLGILYQTMRDFSTETARDLRLCEQAAPAFHLVCLGNAESPVFWKSLPELQQFLDTCYPISLHDILQTSTMYHKPQESMHYALQIQHNGSISSAVDFLSHAQSHVFLYGSGGVGKSTLLAHLQGKNRFFLSISSYGNLIFEPIHQAISCWILVKILLKYRYFDTYPSLDTCIACEGHSAVLQELTELHHLLNRQPQSPEYLLILNVSECIRI